MANRDENGIAHYPGWSLEVLKYLYEERKITASGHEPTDTDPGTSTSVGRLLRGGLYPQYGSLPDRAAGQPGQGARIGCPRRGKLPEA
jgi:kynurenine formamidase